MNTVNNSQNNNDNQSVSSHWVQQNQPHSLSQRHLTQTQMRTIGASQTQQVSYMPSNFQSQNQSEDGSVMPGPFIYGYSVEEIKEEFKNFLINFEKKPDHIQEGMEEENQKYYLEQMDIMKDSGDFFLKINAQHLPKGLYKHLISFPGTIIHIMDYVAQETYYQYRREHMQENNEDEQSIKEDALNILIGVYNLKLKHKIRDINHKSINQLISVRGIVIRCSNVFPEMKRAVFVCTRCNYRVFNDLQQGKVEEPLNCQHCRGKHTFQLKHNLCIYTDKQYIKIQEPNDILSEGQTPIQTTLVAYDQNVDYVRPGDKVECVGVIRTQGVRKNLNKRTVQTVYNTFMDVISFKKDEEERFQFRSQGDEQEGSGKIVFTQKQIETYHRIADDENIYERLVKSLAPSIWENEDVKKGIMCQLFGGTQKDFKKTGKGRFRAEINCLLVGDPSVAKSQMLQYVHKIAPRGVYTSGRGSSAVGLTAYVTRDQETRDIVLESGALVLSDLGICCIDEFDKMDENSRSILLEAMESQTISVAKAGIVAQLNARTAVLAAANPIDSKYNPKKNVIENINLSAPLLSRFDLIYIMLDKAESTSDSRLCSHIMDLYTSKNADKLIDEDDIIQEEQAEHDNEENMLDDLIEGGAEKSKILSKELFAEYVSYARNMIQPKLTDEAVQMLEKQYIELRKQGQSRNVIVCTTRQLESAIRLSEAQARMRLRNEVLKEDVEEAFRLIMVATQMAATDPTTGLIDIDVITTGRSAVSRENVKRIEQLILEITKEDKKSYKAGVPFADLKKALDIKYKDQEKFLKMEEIELALRDLVKDNQIQYYGHEKTVARWTIQYIGN